MSRIILVAITIMSIISFSFASAEHISPAQLLERYKANYGVLGTHITKSEELVEVRDTAYDGRVEWRRYICEFRTDGRKVDVIVDRTVGLDSQYAKGSPAKTTKIRAIWDGNQWFECYPDFGSRKYMSAYIDKRGERKNRFISLAYRGSCLDGIFFGDFQPVNVILKQASKIAVRSQMENVNGMPCYVIDANTPSGEYSLWINPERGYNIVKAKVHKTGSDIMSGKPLNQHFMSVSKGQRRIRYNGIKPKEKEEFFFSLDRVKFQKISDSWVPVEATIQIMTKYVDGRVITEKKHHKRTHIDPNPDFEALDAFKIDLPNGTRVFVEEAQGIRYVWQDGKIVPADDPTFQEIDRMVEEVKKEQQ